MQHDNSYKLLFSYPEMVRDLLQGYVHEPWVQELDWHTLEKVSGQYVSDDLREREDDILWRVRWNKSGDWLYVYLLLEFQSTVDQWMAVRLLTYIGLLYQDLIRGRQLTEDGRLPPVLPLVLYNGVSRWQALTAVEALIALGPEGLERYRPSLQYLLLDEGAIQADADEPLRNLVSALFALEKSATVEDMGRAVTALVEWLKAPEQQGLSRSFTVWIKRVLLPGRMPGIELPEVNDLKEVNAMLAERVIEWTREWKECGRQEGVILGEMHFLRRQLIRRFGELPADVESCLQQATEAELERWSEAILDATTLEAVFVAI